MVNKDRVLPIIHNGVLEMKIVGYLEFPISALEVDAAAKCLQNGSAVGPDGVFGETDSLWTPILWTPIYLSHTC